MADITSEKSSSASALSLRSAQGRPRVWRATLSKRASTRRRARAQLEVRDQRLGAAVAEALLHLAHRGGVDVLVVAGDAADVEDDRHRVDLLAQGAPGLAQLGRLRRGVAPSQGLRDGRAVRAAPCRRGRGRGAWRSSTCPSRRSPRSTPPAGRAAGLVELAAMLVSRRTYCSWMPLGTRRWFGCSSGQPPVMMYSPPRRRASRGSARGSTRRAGCRG
jgi:hypothetical protein